MDGASLRTGLSLVPGYRIIFTRFSAELKGDGNDIEEQQDITTLRLFMGIGFRISPDKILGLNPNISINKNLTTLGLSVNLVFSH